MRPPNAATLFKALADDNRIEIVKTIARMPGITANELLRTLDIAQSTLSHHMRVLREAALVNMSREGKWSHYSLNAEAIDWLDRFVNGLRSDRSIRARRFRLLNDLKRDAGDDGALTAEIDDLIERLR